MRSGSDTAWLSYGAALLLLGLGAYVAGSLMRLGRGNLTVLSAVGVAVLVAVLLAVIVLTDRLASAHARRQVERALGSLDDRYRVFGRVRLHLAGRAPVAAEYVVVGPEERVWTLVLDRSAHGAMRARRAALAAARRAAELLARAAGEGGLPESLGIGRGPAVEPVLVALRRRVDEDVREDGVRVANPDNVARWLDGSGAPCEDRG